MKITVFGKKRTTADGKKFTAYFGKLTKKDGSEITTQIKFREEAGVPSTVPCVIECEKTDMNYTEKVKKYTDKETQEEKETTERTLWVARFNEEEYIDTSMDDFVE